MSIAINETQFNGFTGIFPFMDSADLARFVEDNRANGLRGRVLRVGLELLSDLSEAEWKEGGALLGKIERSVSWWLGDWWAFGEARWGERLAITKELDWEGPTFEVCANIASVCRAFPLESSRRREHLSFKHHTEVAALPPDEADALLDWCEETPKPRSTRELRGERSIATESRLVSGRHCTRRIELPMVSESGA
jgi:hypothetical protein